MNENDFELAARAWLGDGPNRMSDGAVLSTLEVIHTTRQRRVLRPAWRAAPVSFFARFATAAVLVVAVGVLAVTVMPRLPGRSSIGAASPSPSASPVEALAFPSLTRTFVSPRNGFSVMLPQRISITSATNLGFGMDGSDVIETGLSAVFTGTSTGLIPHNGGGTEYVSPDAFVDQLLHGQGGCEVPRTQQAPIDIDGMSGRVAECQGLIEATVFDGGRLYRFSLPSIRPDARAIFDAIIATVRLTPETAVDIPPLTATFVSPTYGYAFGYPGRNGLTPATEHWDPVHQPRPNTSAGINPRFDYVETGLGAVFLSGSTPIPNGVSIDAWIDEHVSPASCAVPRSQQAAITIDGQPGRIAECPGETDATVVVDGRLYLFILGRDNPDAREYFDTWVATIDLRPEDAAAR